MTSGIAHLVGWPLYRLCNRFVGHRWKELEPGVRECRICFALQFEDATFEQLKRYLLDDLRGEPDA